VDSGDSMTFTVYVSGMTGTGTVTAALASGAATSVASSVASSTSTSTDNTVTYNGGPSVRVEQGGSQVDPTEIAPLTFRVEFSVAVSGFAASDIDLSASTAPAGIGLAVATFTPAGDNKNWTFTVRGMSGPGDVVASVPASVATAVVGGAPNEASVSEDNVVTYACAAPDPFDDDFDRPNTSNFTNGSSGDGYDNLGACWKQHSSGLQFWVINSAEMQIAATGGGRIAEPLHELAGPDLTILTFLVDGCPGTFTSTSFYLRCDSGFTTGYVVTFSLTGFGGPDLDVSIAGIGGGGSASGTIIGGGALMTNTWWRLSAVGSTIQAESSPDGSTWTTRRTLTDSTHTTGSHVGVNRSGGGTCKLGSVAVS
jgi:hypothetical protein